MKIDQDILERKTKPSPSRGRVGWDEINKEIDILQADNNSGRHRQIKIFIHIFIPIFFGTTIYALWRGISIVDPNQKTFPLLTTTLPDWLKYNIPDGLWLYAFLSTLVLIWQGKFSRHFVAWLLLAIIISFFLEISQAYDLIPGTFDWNDLLAYSIATFFFFCNFRQSLKF